MLICCAEITGLDEARARQRGNKNKPGSAFARSLLHCAAERYWGEMPGEVGYDEAGRPYFIGVAGKFFSLSHTKTHVMVAVSDSPVGVDIETARVYSERLRSYLMSEEERRDFSLAELWVLRESVFKLLGEGSLREMRFARREGGIAAPAEGVRSALYYPAPGCFAAAAAYEDLPREIMIVPGREICT